MSPMKEERWKQFSEKRYNFKELTKTAFATCKNILALNEWLEFRVGVSGFTDLEAEHDDWLNALERKTMSLNIENFI